MSNDTIHIAYVCDNPIKYHRLLRASMASVKKFNKNVDFTILSKKRFLFPGAKVVTFDPGKAKFRLIKGKRLGEGCYYKFWLPLLPYKKILYIDCDVICQRPLASLWETECDFICATESYLVGEHQAVHCGVARYALSGMMLMNLDALRKENFTDRCIRRMMEEPAPGFDEQVINKEFSDRIQFIDKKYNYCHNREYKDPIPEADAYLLHFVGDKKSPALTHQTFSSLKALKKVFKGKQVAVVGNAVSILGTGHGKEIDSYDCVLRFNHGVPSKHKDDTGTKTTLVITASTLTPDELRDFNSDFIAARASSCKTKCDFVFGDNCLASFLMGKTPNTIEKWGEGHLAPISSGLLGVYFLLASGAKSIDLYGFDFFKTETWHNERPVKTLHNGRSEEEKIRELEENGLIRII